MGEFDWRIKHVLQIKMVASNVNKNEKSFNVTPVIALFTLFCLA